eukprot:3863135-Amphidinium_carterae.1
MAPPVKRQRLTSVQSTALYANTCNCKTVSESDDALRFGPSRSKTRMCSGSVCRLKQITAAPWFFSGSAVMKIGYDKPNSNEEKPTHWNHRSQPCQSQGDLSKCQMLAKLTAPCELCGVKQQLLKLQLTRMSVCVYALVKSVAD